MDSAFVSPTIPLDVYITVHIIIILLTALFICARFAIHLIDRSRAFADDCTQLLSILRGMNISNSEPLADLALVAFILLIAVVSSSYMSLKGK